MKFNDTLTEIVRLDLETGQVPALIGEPGIGKSSFVTALAKAMDTRAFVLSCNQLSDKADLTGARLVPYTKSDGSQGYMQEFFPHATVQMAVDYAKENPYEKPILFFDEVNRSSSDITSASLTMITERRLGKEEFPDNLRMMVAGNDKGNVTALDEASLSRFSIYHVEPDAQTLIARLGDSLNPLVKKVLAEFPHLVFQKSRPAAFAVAGDDDDDTQTAAFADLMDAGEEMRQLTTPRTIDGASRWLNAVDAAKLQEWLQTPSTIGDRQTTVLNEILEGHLGDTDFTTQLVKEIASSLASGQSTASSQLAAPKPARYDQLKQAASITDLEDAIGQLSDKEKSGSILYALYEKADNARLLQHLAASATDMEADHKRLFVQLASQSLLDDGNTAALTGTTSPVGDAVKMMLSIMS